MHEHDENQYIMNEPLIKIRVLTGQFMRGNTTKYMLGIFLFFLLTETVANILGVLIPEAYSYAANANIPAEIMEQMPSLPYSSVLYTMIMIGAFEYGRTLYQLSFLRNGTFDYQYLFEGFSFYFKAFLITFIRSILMSVGFMLLILPGVIVLYYYRQALFILADDPSKGVFQVLRESRKMMDGNKMSLFRLDFSFFLMYFLANLPSSLMAGMVSDTVPGMIEYTILRLPVYIVLGNMYINRTVFYELLVSKGFKNFKYKNEELFRAAP